MLAISASERARFHIKLPVIEKLPTSVPRVAIFIVLPEVDQSSVDEPVATEAMDLPFA